MIELASFKHLHTLDIGNTRVTDEGLKHLAGLMQLQRLSLYASRNVSDAGLKELMSNQPSTLGHYKVNKIGEPVDTSDEKTIEARCGTLQTLKKELARALGLRAWSDVVFIVTQAVALQRRVSCRGSPASSNTLASFRYTNLSTHGTAS